MNDLYNLLKLSFLISFFALSVSTSGQTPGFTLPDTVCVNAPVNIVNTSVGGSSFFWSFCAADLTQAPEAVNLGNISNVLSQPVFISIASQNGNYYGFVTDHYPGGLVRLDFGNSLLNTPVATSLGNFGGIINSGYGTEGMQVVQSNGRWYAIIVGGSPTNSSVPKVVRIDFGANLNNPAPVATDWGNIGGLAFPIKLYIFQENGNWHGFTVNVDNNTITRLDFGTDFINPPTGVNLGNPGGLLVYPCGIYALNDAGNWRVFISNGVGGALVRLDFGSSLLNTPAPVNLGNPGNVISGGRDITIVQSCDQVIGFVTDGTTNTLDRLDFHNDVTSVPSVVSLGNIGNFSLPHSLATLFREGPDLYTFIPNAFNNTISRIRFPGCTNSSIPNSALATPPVVSYAQPGTYNINLTMDDGLPSQSTFCKNITVLASPSVDLGKDTAVCMGDSVILRYKGPPLTHLWQDGSTADTLVVYNSGQYTLTASQIAGCSASGSVKVQVLDRPSVATLPDTSICPGSSLQLTTRAPDIDSIKWTPGAGLSDPAIASPFALPPPGVTQYIVTAWEGRCPSKDTVNINLLSTPTLTINADTLICSGATIQLKAGGADFYTWSPARGLTDPGVAAPLASPDSTRYYHVKGTGANNTCSSYDSVLVRVKYRDVFKAGPSPVNLCVGDTVLLKVQGGDASAGDTYTWLSDIGGQDPSSSEIRAAPPVSESYQVVGFDRICDESDTLSLAVTVLERPSVAITKSNDIDCIYGEARLTATGGVRYAWSPDPTLSDTLSSDPVARTPVTTLYEVTVTGENGCTISDTIRVYVTKGSGAIGFPVANAFTPNGDGANDCFGIKYWGYIDNFDMEVFNRWGRRVFYSRNPDQCWDGTLNGQKQPAGTYVYVIKAKTICGDTVRKGTVQLIR